MAKKVGFKNINVDLMIGLPNQNLKDVKKSVEELIKLNPQHISVYSLIVEENTLIGSKDYENYTIEFEMGGKKFVLRDKETGAIVMNGERTKTEMSGDDAFLVDWTDDLFSDWKEYADGLGWEKPAVFEFEPFLLDDIIE